jgi:hypothetical protein
MIKLLDSMVHIGKYHVQHYLPCQDRAIAVQDNGLVILAVADGMGSYEHAELGAEFAVNYIKDHGGSLMRFAEDITSKENMNFRKRIRKFMLSLGNDIVKYSFSIGLSPDKVHTTLSFSLIDSGHFLNISIGDSPIYTLTKDGPMFLDGNDNGSGRENINQTYSVADMGYSIKYMGVQAGLTKNLSTILITSDGAIGWSKQKQLLNSENFGDLPVWYYEMLASKRDLKATVEKLIEDGYDDVGIAYYVNDKTLLS